MRRRPSVAILCSIALTLILPLICSGEKDQSASEPQTVTSQRTLKIGLVPEQNVFAQKRSYEPLLAQLAMELGISIEIIMLPGYGNIIENFQNLGLDGAFFGSFTGALAIKSLGLVPLARPEHMDGSSTYHGMVFSKKGSGIRTAEDLRGKRMVFVDRATTAGYLLPLTYFKSLGIHDYTTWFAEYYFSGTHENAIKDVLDGYADIGAAKNTVFDRMAAVDPRVSRELEIIATSPHVPANGLAVRSDLGGELIEGLKEHLLAMHQSKRGHALLAKMQIRRFIATSADDYQSVLDYADSIELDLTTYNALTQKSE